MLRTILRSLFRPGARRLIERGLALRAQGDLRAAEQVLREAAQRFPRESAAAVNLALVLLEQHRAAEGAAELERALVLAPADGAANYNYANLLRVSGRQAEALRAYERAADAGFAPARQELLFALLEVCAWERAGREAARLRAHCDAAGAGWMRAVAPLSATYLGLDDATCIAVAAFHASEAAQGARPVKRATPPRAGDRLRIAYLSPDFREHPVGHLLAAMLPQHDRNRVEVTAYSCGVDDRGATRRAIAGGADRFVDLATASDDAAAAAIAADGIDVLVDLAGHTTGGRLGILARRPAPVQAHYLGYAATTGAPYIDYFIGDRVTTPHALDDAFTEKLACVPDCFMVGGAAPAPAEMPGRAAQDLPAEATVFAAFTNASRITREVFAAWMEILRAVPGSVLWLKQAQPATMENLRTAAAQSGVDAARLVFASRVPARADHLARLALADLALDTFGWHNGHSTTCELLWAGVPVLTTPGASFAARVGASLVSAAGMPALVAHDVTDYVATASRLGGDRTRLDALRAQLAANRAHAPLFDTRRGVAGLEAVFVEMWRRHCRGDAPQRIEAAP